MPEQYTKRGGLLWVDNEYWQADRAEIEHLKRILGLKDICPHCGRRLSDHGCACGEDERLGQGGAPYNYESLEEWCSELEEMNDKLIAANRELQDENERLTGKVQHLEELINRIANPPKHYGYYDYRDAVDMIYESSYFDKEAGDE